MAITGHKVFSGREAGLAWIKQVDEAEAEGPLKAAYARYQDVSKSEKVANILKVHGLSPQSLNLHFDYYRHLTYGKGPLKRYQRELIAVYVSKLNSCFY